MSSVKAKVVEAISGVKHTGQGETILVTGGSGFIAAHILNAFLDRGYNVRATVRSQALQTRSRRPMDTMATSCLLRLFRTHKRRELLTKQLKVCRV